MLKVLAFAAILVGAPTGDTKVVLTPVAPQVIAAEAAVCLKHMSVKGFDPAGLEAEGWKPHRPSALPERHFIDSVTLYDRGEGVVLAYVGASEPSSGCTVVARPTPSPAFGPIIEQISAKLGAHPVFQKPGSVLWAPNGPDDVLVLLTEDPIRSDLVDVVTRVSARAGRDRAGITASQRG